MKIDDFYVLSTYNNRVYLIEVYLYISTKSYFALFIAGISGTFSLYKIKGNGDLKLIDKEV